MDIVEEYEKGSSVESIARGRDMEVEELVNGLLSAGVVIRRMRSIAWVGEKHIRCSKCNSVKPAANFPKSKDKTRPEGYYLSYCKTCRTIQLSERNRQRKQDAPLLDKMNRARLRAGTLGLPFNLDLDYLDRLWLAQGDLCVYTGEKMQLAGAGTGRNTLAASLDRLDNSKGYVKGNVVFCTNRANSIKTDMSLDEFKRWMPGWYKSGLRLINEGDF